MRKGILQFIDGLSRIEGLEEIALTTNGVFLKDFTGDLRDCGLCRINVSMDTLIPDRFFHITRRDLFHQAWEGIEEAESVGSTPSRLCPKCKPDQIVPARIRRQPVPCKFCGAEVHPRG